MRRSIQALAIASIILLSLLPASTLFGAEQPAVRAILFYSPTCPHCHEVINNGLPPIVDHYGDRLQILLINVQTAGGQQLYRAAMEWTPLPPEVTGVPLLIVGHQYLYGSVDIPTLLPGIVEQGLAQGGIDWPDMAGMDVVLAELEARQATVEAEATPVAESEAPAPQAITDAIAGMESLDDAGPSLGERLALDPAGNGLALLMLAGMAASLIVIGRSWLRHGPRTRPARGWQVWALPALALAGLAVALYLAFIETTGAEAVCGPVGDCNAVQQSPYAFLFGLIPIGVLGAAGYIVILAAWAWQRFGPPAGAAQTRWMLPALALFGVAFSLYLTLLEPFVIGAVCMWCLSSALIMTLLFWAVYRWQWDGAR